MKKVGKAVAGPDGRVTGAIIGEELHADGTHEDKIFAPGYGEFRTAGGGDLEAMALAVPANALAGPEPQELRELATGAVGTITFAWKETGLRRRSPFAICVLPGQRFARGGSRRSSRAG